MSLLKAWNTWASFENDHFECCHISHFYLHLSICQVEVYFTGARKREGSPRTYNPNRLFEKQISLAGWFFQFKYLAKRGKGKPTPKGHDSSIAPPWRSAEASTANEFQLNFSLCPILLIFSSHWWWFPKDSCIKSLLQGVFFFFRERGLMERWNRGNLTCDIRCIYPLYLNRKSLFLLLPFFKYWS